jgi:predicted PurR-regulated permease PerM
MNEPISAGALTAQARWRVQASELPARRDVRSIALTGLFVLALFYTMYFMRSILLPLILAVLLSYLLRPVVRALGHLRIPAAVATAFLLLVLGGTLDFAVSFLATPANAWLTKSSR